MTLARIGTRFVADTRKVRRVTRLGSAQRFQKALEHSERTELDRRHKALSLAQINEDFVATAVNYAKVLRVRRRAERPLT
jgi:hypothetical protein